MIRTKQEIKAQKASIQAMLTVVESQSQAKICQVSPSDQKYGRWSHYILGGRNLKYFQVTLQPYTDRFSDDPIKGWRIVCMDNGDNSLHRIWLFPKDCSEEKRQEIQEKALRVFNQINNFITRKTLVRNMGFEPW